MKDRDGERSRQVAEIAGRLRLLQEDFADEPPEVRQSHLCEAIEQALSGIVPDQRDAFLKALRDRFPSLADGQAAWPPGEAKPAETGADEPAGDDPQTLVTRLIAAVGALPEEEREQIAARLREAGLAGDESDGADVEAWSSKDVSDLRSKLRIAAHAHVDPGRVLELGTVLLPFAVELDRLATEMWRGIARGNPKGARGDFHKQLGTFVTGNEQVTRDDIARQVEQVRRLIASMISALSLSWKFAQQHAEKTAPAKIEKLAEQGMKKWNIFGESIEQTCWRTYKDIANKSDPGAIEHELKQRIAEYVEEMIR